MTWADKHFTVPKEAKKRGNKASVASRRFLYRDTGDFRKVPRSVPLKGIMKCHCLYITHGSVLYREMSCVCEHCVEGDWGQCLDGHTTFNEKKSIGSLYERKKRKKK